MLDGRAAAGIEPGTLSPAKILRLAQFQQRSAKVQKIPENYPKYRHFLVAKSIQYKTEDFPGILWGLAQKILKI